MSEYKHIISRRYTYGGHRGLPSACYLDVWTDGSSFTVMFTEADDNPGTSVTNFSERLANSVSELLGHPSQVKWIEHYPANKFYKAYFDEVTYSGRPGNYYSPQWTPMDLEHVPAGLASSLFLEDIDTMDDFK